MTERFAKSFKQDTGALGSAFMSYAQEQIEDAVQTAQQLLNCRTLEDMAALQTRYVQQSFDRFVKKANTLTQTAANKAKDRSGALNNQWEQFVQRITRAA
jgi:phasin family protein